MSQHGQKPRESSPMLDQLVFTALWSGLKRPYLGVPAVSAGFVLIVLLFVFGTRSGWTSQRRWEKWLENFRFTGAGPRNARAQFGVERKREPRRMESLPAYLGDGEAELGDYSIRVFDPLTQLQWRTDFRLIGTTTIGDETSFSRFMHCNHQFFREQVAVVLRTHNLNDLTDPDLDLLGRKIVARVNRSLGERVLKSAQVRDYAVYESIDRSGFVLYEPDMDDGVP